jgi:hypothetical protein
MANGRDGLFEVAQQGDSFTIKSVACNKFVGISFGGGILLNVMSASSEYKFKIEKAGDGFTIKNGANYLSIQEGNVAKHFAPCNFKFSMEGGSGGGGW